MPLRALFLLWLLAAGAHAQTIPAERPRARPPSALAGWADWERGEELLKRLNVPPAPVRTPEEELATFRVAPGYSVELVAAEPMVQKPIFFEFDPEGRIWVVEYQGYMRDLAGKGEGDPICRVVVLEDTDADGRADKHTVFLDKLVMPRSFAFVKGGLLLQEPPTLWFCEDLDGDLRCDRKRVVGKMGVGGNPQHTANGLRYGIDNWLHCADWPKKYRWRDGKLIEAETLQRGQFGVTFDETGRFLTCYENKALHGDLIPPEYILRNPNLRKVYERAGGDRSAFGVNVNLAKNAQEIFPIRVTPAITLGALELRDDGRLKTYTIASGICYYDGHQFPEDARHNVFVPDSGGHLIGRLVLPPGLEPQARRFYPPEQEFLASTDERFRPVNARVGPDGALYLADMYHGIIEHVIFMVPWLEKQIRDRRLDHGNDLGRIWRVVAENRPLDRKAPRLSSATDEELIATLGHPNGWHRLTAQRLLVERGNKSLDTLKRAVGSTNRDAALHAAWTLNGLGALDSAVLDHALDHEDERVRLAAIRLCEREKQLDPNDHEEVIRRIYAHLEGRGLSTAERLQLALTIGAFSVTRGGDDLLASLLATEESPLFRVAALSALAGRELHFLTMLLKTPRWPGFERLLDAPRPRRDASITMLAECVLARADGAEVGRLMHLFSTEAGAKSSRGLAGAFVSAFAAARPAKPIALAQAPATLVALAGGTNKDVAKLAQSALANFIWPGPATSQAHSSMAPLKPDEAKLVEVGRQTYAALCAACHQPHGGGTPSVAPPLAGSDWIKAAPDKLARIVLHGLYGPIDVNGQRWNLHMPGLAALGDKQLASALSYVRTAWGNAEPVIKPEVIAAARQETAGRTLPFRAEELGFTSVAAADHSTIQPDATGTLTVPAKSATIYGHKLAYSAALDVLANWRIKDDAASWTVSLTQAGEYDAFITLAADDASAGDQFALETETGRAIGTVASTGSYQTFREVAVGRLTLRAGENRILLRPHGPLREELADIRAVRLTPTR